MKRFLLLVLVFICVLGLSACGNVQDDAASTADLPSSSAPLEAPEAGAEEDAETAPMTAAPTLAPSSNKTVVTADTAPEVYWDFDIAYHLTGCEVMNAETAQKVSWEVVEQIGLRQCPACNPPQYENYIENQ